MIGRDSGRTVRADQRQALAFMDGVKKHMTAAAKKRNQPQVLHVTQLPDLAQLLKKDTGEICLDKDKAPAKPS